MEGRFHPAQHQSLLLPFELVAYDRYYIQVQILEEPSSANPGKGIGKIRILRDFIIFTEDSEIETNPQTEHVFINKGKPSNCQQAKISQ